MECSHELNEKRGEWNMTFQLAHTKEHGAMQTNGSEWKERLLVSLRLKRDNQREISQLERHTGYFPVHKLTSGRHLYATATRVKSEKLLHSCISVCLPRLRIWMPSLI